MIELNVKFVRRLYGTEDGDFSIFAAEPASGNDLKYVSISEYGTFTISGEFSLEDSELGNTYKVNILEDRNSRYPNSYKLVKLHYTMPETPESQWEFFSNALKGVHPLIIINTRKHFGSKSKILDIVLEDPMRLREVDKVGTELALEIKDIILESKNKALLFEEYGHIDGVGPATIKVLQKFRANAEETIAMIKQNPFSILELGGIGFLTADKFRAHYDLPHDSDERILHGTSYYIDTIFQSTGNTYEDIFEAGKTVASKLGVSYKKVIELLASVKDDKEISDTYKIKIFGKNITTKSLFDSEYLVYKTLTYLKESKNNILSKEVWDKHKDNLVGDSVELSEGQDNFLSLINEEKVVALLGPGGSGKSWVTKIACELLSQAGMTYGLFAPTARAAHVMSEYVGVQASTIHRGLMSFAHSGEQVPFDVIIVDEASMVDSELAGIVMKTMGVDTRLILIGDDFQLQSVGPGNILFDVVNHVEIPTVHLTSIFRQEEGSGILEYANEMRNGTFEVYPSAPKVDGGDIVFINESDSATQNKLALELYKKATIDTNTEDIMLLSPVNNGDSGRQTLNKAVQDIVNPLESPNDIIFGAGSKDKSKIKRFKQSDYISVKRNEYNMESDAGEITQVINGDLGYVIKTTKNTLTFSIDKHRYTIDKSEINDLIEHAWSITIHKSQGGQADIVIIVLPYNSYFMLSANMLYTAITRAKKKCYVIGDFSGINKSAKIQANLRRKTMISLQRKG